MAWPIVHAAHRSRRELRSLIGSGDWVRLHRGIYVPTDRSGDADVRAAAALAAVPGGVASHDTAAALWGIGLVRPTGIEHVTVPPAQRRPSRATIRVHARGLKSTEAGTRCGLPVTTAGRTLADISARSDRLTAVWAIEQALTRRIIDRHDLSGWRSLAARRHATLADNRSESPLETGVRLAMIDGGPPRPEVQIPITDRYGRTLFRIDLGYRERRIGIETDGRTSHDLPRAIYADRWRANALNGQGWRLLRFTWADLARRPAYIVGSVRAALAEAA